MRADPLRGSTLRIYPSTRPVPSRMLFWPRSSSPLPVALQTLPAPRPLLDGWIGGYVRALAYGPVRVARGAVFDLLDVMLALLWLSAPFPHLICSLRPSFPHFAPGLMPVFNLELCAGLCFS